ncbi:MAG: PH domain-containing protein [Ruminococcaceae bacterium]|nr:PH domain-containing protein [Oscillospiraceae bacterium]
MAPLRKPSRRILPVWYGELLVAEGFLFLAGATLSAWLPGELIALGGGILGGASLFAALWALPARYRKEGYRLTDRGIERTGGIFYSRKYYLPFSAVRYFSLRADPFRQMAGVGTAVLHGAGLQLRLDGLSPEACRELADHLEHHFSNQTP